MNENRMYIEERKKERKNTSWLCTKERKNESMNVNWYNVYKRKKERNEQKQIRDEI